MSSGEVLANVLIVDDKADFRMVATDLAQLSQCAVVGVGSLQEARRAVSARPYDLVLLDLSLPDGDGLDLLQDIDLAANGQIAVVTGNPTVESAIKAVRGPIVDYLVKPVQPATLCALFDRARDRAQSRPNAQTIECGDMVAHSALMKNVIEQLSRVAPLDATVFICGESGTGKELAARAIHEFSKREGAFVAVNCGAVAAELLSSQLFGHERGSFTGAVQSHAGYFEQAQGGTLFLDEVTEMPLSLQVYLLRALETRKVTRVGGSKEIPIDVRIVAATNREPQQAVADGLLRTDLYYRLFEFPVRMPALRERRSDIPALAQRFLDRLNERYSTQRKFSPEALRGLVSQAWPGNVRELRHAIQRGYIMATGDFIEPPAPEPARAFEESDGSVQFRVGMTFEDIERQMLLKTLAFYNNNKRQAARALGITAKTIYNRLAHYRSLGLIDGSVASADADDEADVVE